MSRCFPFPPPGYEIKASPENVNLLLKEKHKHKKHKDKKDKDKKEKKERSEKKEGKHKDGKDRKEKKHRDDKYKKKDKHKSSEEKKIVGCFENQNGEKFVPDDSKPSEKKTVGCFENQSSQKFVSHDSKPIEKIEDNRMLAELGKRVRDDGGATDSQMVDKKIILVEQKQEKNAYNKIPEKRELMANGNILKVEAKGSRNGFVGNFFAEKIEGGLCEVEKIQKRNEGKEKNENGNGVGENDRSKSEDRAKKREEKKRKKERKKEKKREKEKKKEMKERSKENIKQRENDANVLYSRDNNPSDHLKENGFRHDNGFRPNNTSRPDQVTQNGSGFHPSPQTIGDLAVVEKSAVITSHQKINVITNHVEKEDVITNQKINIITNQKINGKISSTCNNHGMNNGFISLQPSANSTKVKQIIDNHHSADDKFPPFVENGRKPDDKEKESKMNGVLEGKMDISSMPSIKTKEKKARTKPPHPDLKYLSQILTVPKLDFSPQFDDQDWLFGYKDSQAKRPKLASSRVDEWTHKQVWAEAIVMGPSDVIALPYVIPY